MASSKMHLENLTTTFSYHKVYWYDAISTINPFKQLKCTLESKLLNGPYSLLVRASYFISCSVYSRSTSVIFIVCKWRWGCRYFLTSRISVSCSEAIGLIIR